MFKTLKIMTTKIVSIAAIACLIAVSCNKQGNNVSATQAPTKTPAVAQKATGGTMYKNLIKETFDCGKDDGTCIGPIIITAPRPDWIDHIAPTLNTGTPATLRALFNESGVVAALPGLAGDPGFMALIHDGAYSRLLVDNGKDKRIYLFGTTPELTTENSTLIAPIWY